MNAVFAAVLLAVVATVSGTSVVSTIGGSSLLYSSPAAVQYVAPSNLQYQYVQQPYVASSAVVQNTVPVTYASSAVVPSTSYLGYQYAYPYSYGLLKK